MAGVCPAPPAGFRSCTLCERRTFLASPQQNLMKKLRSFLLIVGLGIFQRLSAEVERKLDNSPKKSR